MPAELAEIRQASLKDLGVLPSCSMVAGNCRNVLVSA
jgi:hypothetical protein